MFFIKSLYGIRIHKARHEKMGKKEKDWQNGSEKNGIGGQVRAFLNTHRYFFLVDFFPCHFADLIRNLFFVFIP